MQILKRSVLLALLAVFLGSAGCGTKLPTPQTAAQVLTILTDARYGVDVGCTAEWLEPPVCVVAYRILDDAHLALLEAATNGWAPAAKAVLITEEGRLSPGSKLRPYLDAAIALL